MKFIKICNENDRNELSRIMTDLFIEMKKPVCPIVFPYYYFLLTIVVDNRYAKPAAYYSDIAIGDEIYSVEGWCDLLCIDD